MCPHPAFSIVVPTYQRPERLAACVRAVAGLRPPDGGFELIVVNDGGDDPEPVIAEAVASSQAAIDWRCLNQNNAGPAAARNHGVAHARGRFIAFTDDDCTPELSWLTSLAPHLDRAPDALVGGSIVNRLPHAASMASQQLIDYLYRYFDGRPGRPRFFCSNNMALTRDAFERVGAFDVSILRAAAEDRELCDRWHHRGLPLVYAPDAVVGHAHAMTVRQFWRQHVNYGRGAHYFRAARAADGRGGVRREPWAFYFGLLAHPFRDRVVGHPLRQAALMVLSQIANTAGYIAQSRHPAAAEDCL